jgi:multidrug efflux system outer membrane protein
MSVTMIDPVHPTPQAEAAWDRALDEALARPLRRPLAQPVVKTVAKFAPRFASVLVALLLSACAAPAFRQPDVTVPAAFKEAPPAAAGVHNAAEVRSAADGSTWKQAAPADSQPRGEWWKAFGDSALDALEADAIANNQNVAVALARLKQARAIAGIAEAARSPQIDLNAGAQRMRQSPLEARQPAGTPVAPATAYQAKLSASYEVDLFGRVASGVAAARGDAGAAQANFRAVLLSMEADVAQTYFRLRALDAEIETAGRAVALREESVKLTGRRFELGDIGEFDLARARTELASARAEAVGLQRQRANAEHALAVLLGKPVAAFTAPARPLAEAEGLPAIPAGLPSALLERRPDIVAAQRTMEASNARIGVARAAMFPAVSLGASGGGVAGSAGDVLAWSARSWVLGAALALPLFDGGRRHADVARSEAVLEEAVGAYRQRVLVAFAEVEDNLAGLRILGEQGEQLELALMSARRSADLAQKLYDAGRSGYLELLDAQRNLAQAERSVVQLRGERAITTVALVRALGGGWDATIRPHA